ncbi:hypothetical protein HDU92_007968 [Lobulomyces angularis]|nr:hypothetical protein HDU92_007968 [Lobulomyces angularis]
MPNLINTMMELRKCCIHPFLLKGAEDQIISEYSADTAEKQFAALIQASGKMVLIDKLLTKLKAGGHKVLIFSQMTRCLDIIQDYLRGKRYGFERIDGSVRGDLRQASIDRFCSRESESFVFLLCTRAGGVGINLTVADTVIIFDSDWNPQNDLQAQARCHRIGQTKSVQIYRLITRNTYERDMFDRASMKLGLDKAILQRMDVNASMREEDPFESKAPSALSKQEVEKLLKKGAYGAFLDDEASEKFCEEDIDSILERRTQVIKHDSGVTTEKGSIFSKASFASAQSNQVDIDDPDFWDKIAAKAELHIEEPLDELDTLIQYEPRQRRQVRRFGADEIGGDSDDDDYNIGDSVTSNNSAADPSIKLWSITEKTRFERALMLYGYGCWEKILPLFPRREEKDLIAVTDLIMKFCIKRSIQDPDLVRDIRRILDIEITDESALDENLENPIRLTEDIILPEIPYEGATKKQISEYRSFLLDASKEYQEHIERKSKNLLNRIQMLYGIRFRVQPHPEIEMPPILGNPPVPWWGADEDRDLLLGTLKYGYAAYDKMRYDPEFCFNKRVYIDTLESVTIDELAEAKKGKISELPEGQENSGKLSQNNEELQDIVKENNDVKKMTIEGGETDVETVDIEKEEKLTKEVKNTTDDASSELSQVEEKVLDAKEGEAVKWPGPADLGVRIRRILAAFLRQFATIARRSAKKQLREEKNKEKRTNEAERRRQFTKKERIEFRRVLLSFGVETDPNNRNVRIWDRFRYLSAIHKTDEVLEENYLNTISMCHECIEKAERIKDGKESKDELKYDKDDNKDDVNDENEEKDEKDDKDDDDKDDLKNFRIERGTESISLEIARRMLKRIEMMRKLREEIITHPNIDTNTGNIKRHQRSGLPSWWLPEHDKYFILGIARWGITRTDSMVEDETLPFKKMQEEWQRKRDAGDEVACKDERFWMKETVAGRRFDSLCEAILKPPQKKNKKGRKKRDDDLDSDDDAMWQGDTVKKKMKKKEVSPVQRQSSFSPIKKKKRKGKFNDGGYGSLDFGNPDDMLSSENESGLDRVLHRIKRERKLAKKLLFDNEESTIILNNAGNNIFQKSYFKRIKRDLRKDWKKLYFNKNIHEEKRNKLPPLENETNIFEVLNLAGNLIAECRKETELVLGLKKRKLSDAQNIISGESLKLSDF